MTEATAGATGLVLTEVSAGYNETVVLHRISFTVAPRSTVALLGRNGVGKTTLLATVMGYTQVHGGSIEFRGKNLRRLPIYRRPELGLALVPQEREIFRSLTVEENLEVGQRPGRWVLARIYDLFPGLAARRRNRGDQLSGGEQQMLAIGRALMGNPTYLLLDEPLEGLAPVIVDQVLASLEKLKAEENLSMVLVEQHAHLALQFSQTAIVLDRGAIVYSGLSRELAGAPDLMSDLLGIGRSIEPAGTR
jgi:branched-chain amino acid transport system ATP-binding protein